MPFYHDTEIKIKVGDRITWGGRQGVIIFVFDDEQFSSDYPKDDWVTVIAQNEGKGIGMLIDGMETPVIDIYNEDIELIKPANEKRG